MQLAFLLPSIHNHPTGGNIYNRRMVAALSDRCSVDAHPWPTVEASTFSWPDTTVVVDSLLLSHPSARKMLRQSHNDGPLVLMAHYLHCIDPNERCTAQAETERGLLSLFDRIVTTSEYAKRALVEEGVAAPTIFSVPPGLDAQYRAPVPDPPSNDSPTLLTVANVVSGKGLPALVRRLDALADLDWHWQLAGDDTLDPDATARLQDALQSTSVAHRITGPMRIPPDQMRAQYDRASLFVLPSRFETCSMATREALARGCPVVGCAVGGLPENLGAAANPRFADPPRSDAAPDAPSAGRLVPPDAPEALIEAVRTLLTNPESRAAMRSAARTQSRTFPSWSTAADRFHSALQSLQDGSS